MHTGKSNNSRLGKAYFADKIYENYFKTFMRIIFKISTDNCAKFSVRFRHGNGCPYHLSSIGKIMNNEDDIGDVYGSSYTLASKIN